MDPMYKVPSDETVTECVITKEAVKGKEEPQLLHGEQRIEKKPAAKRRKTDNESA